jgi:hypothetical protein
VCEIVTGDETWCFNMIPKVNNKVSNGNSRHPYDPKKLGCRNHKWRQCSSLSSMWRVLFTLNSFHKAKQPMKLVMWKYWSGREKLCIQKGLNCDPAIGFSIMTMLQLTGLCLSSSFWPKNWLLKLNTHSVFLIWLWITCGCFQNKVYLRGTKISGHWSHPVKKCDDGTESYSTTGVPKCFQQWQHRWDKCTAAEGGYLEGDSSQ